MDINTYRGIKTISVYWEGNETVVFLRTTTRAWLGTVQLEDEGFVPYASGGELFDPQGDIEDGKILLEKFYGVDSRFGGR